MQEMYDALVIGAGPAGLAAGIVLARQGLRILVSDRRRLPIDKVCGEGVLPPGLVHLRRLDVLKNLDVDEVHPFVGICMRSPRGVIASASFAEGPGLGIRRSNLSRALWRTAQGFPNLEIQDATPIHELKAIADGTEVHLGGRKVTARLLIGADGLNSGVRRWAGLDGGAGRLQRLGTRQHFRIAPWSDHVEVYYGRGIEAYVTPCGKDLTGVAVLWDRNCRPRIRGGAALLLSLLCAFPDLEKRLLNAEQANVPQGVGPLHRVARGCCADGVILVGDAAGYLDACTGEGISLALGQAVSLEATVAPLLRQTRVKPNAKQLRGFAQACRQITWPYYQGTRLLLHLSRNPLWFERLVTAFRVNPDIMQHFLSAQTGQASLWPGWSKAVRLLQAFVCERSAAHPR